MIDDNKEVIYFIAEEETEETIEVPFDYVEEEEEEES